jgi:hypothetical protein
MKKKYNAPVQKKGRGRMTNYKPNGIHSNMQSGIHAISPNTPIPTPHHPNSLTLHTLLTKIESY